MAPLPAFAQVQPAKKQQKRKRGENVCGEPVKAKKPRRKPGDVWAGPLGIDETQDVVRLYEWVQRGHSEKKQEMLRFRGRWMNVAEAYATLQNEGRVILTPSPDQSGVLPADVSGYEQPIFNTAEGLQPQHMGFQFASLSDPQVSVPTCPPAPALPQQGDFLQEQEFGFQQPIFDDAAIFAAQQAGLQQAFNIAEAIPAQPFGADLPIFPALQASVPADPFSSALPQQGNFLQDWPLDFDPAPLSPGLASMGAVGEVADPTGSDLNLPEDALADWWLPLPDTLAVDEHGESTEDLQAAVTCEFNEADVPRIDTPRGFRPAEEQVEDFAFVQDEDFADLFNWDV